MLISLKDITIEIEGKVLIDNFSLEILHGEKLVIKGMSGKGKTTLLNLMLGFTQYAKGSYFFEGNPVTKNNISEVRKHYALLPQNLNFGKEKVADFIDSVFNYSFNRSLKPGTEEISDLSKKLLLDDSVLKNNMSDISGGEKQRIAILCCLLLKRKILLLDEPTSALDSTTKNIVIDMFLKNKDLTVISTSHDDEWAAACERIIQI